MEGTGNLSPVLRARCTEYLLLLLEVLHRLMPVFAIVMSLPLTRLRSNGFLPRMALRVGFQVEEPAYLDKFADVLAGAVKSKLKDKAEEVSQYVYFKPLTRASY